MIERDPTIRHKHEQSLSELHDTLSMAVFNGASEEEIMTLQEQIRLRCGDIF